MNSLGQRGNATSAQQRCQTDSAAKKKVEEWSATQSGRSARTKQGRKTFARGKT